MHIHIDIHYICIYTITHTIMFIAAEVYITVHIYIAYITIAYNFIKNILKHGVLFGI